MDKKSLVVGNWKMTMSYKGELEVAKALKKISQEQSWPHTDVVICPSYPSLENISGQLKNIDSLQVGAQHVHWEESGAFTGSVSIAQINPFVNWCVVGHSEQRRLCGITAEQVGQTVANLLKHGINPIVCIGETGSQKEKDQSIAVITGQVKTLLNYLNRAVIPKLVITYEPIWAISANNPDQLPDPTEIASTMLLIRKIISAQYDHEVAERVRVLYGGSVKVSNADLYLKEPGVDGVLVGSVSIHPRQFIEIISQAEQLYAPTN